MQNDFLKRRTQTQEETADNLLQRARAARASPRDIYGIAPFGMPTLDRLTGGMGADWNVLLAARPGWGKSSLAVQFAENMAKHFIADGSGLYVKIASYEMTPEEYLDRVACCKAGIESSDLKRGHVSDIEFARYERVVQSLANLPIEYTKAQTTFSDFVEFVMTGRPCGVWVLDHVGLLTDVSNNVNNATGAMKVIANRLKVLCKDKKKPGIIVCHMNRASLSNKDGRARLDNLGYADEFGKNADLVLSIFKPNANLELPEDLKGEPEVAYIDMLKHRHGKAANIKTYWFPDRTMFKEAPTEPTPQKPPTATGKDKKTA